MKGVCKIQLFQRLCHGNGILYHHSFAYRDSFRKQIIHVQTDYDRIIVPNDFLYFLQCLNEKSHAFFPASSICVCSLVPCGRKKLIDQISSSAHDQKRIKSCPFQSACRLCICPYHMLDLWNSHSPGTDLRMILGLTF